MEQREYRVVGKSFRKKDSMQLLLGKPVYMDDVTPDALVVKILRSPHANAIVQEINTKAARLVPGVVDIYTWEDVPKTRFAIAGQTYPEPSPYDRLILDRHVRFSGDAVAIIAAETEKAALKAMKLIKVKYEVLVLLTDMTLYADALSIVSNRMDQIPSKDSMPGSLYSDLAKIYEKAVQLPTGGSITIIAVTTLNDGDITHAIPDNTGYITEGWAVLKAANADGSENEDGIDLSAPFLAFYGDWTKAPIIDSGFWWETLGSEEDTTAQTYNNEALLESMEKTMHTYLGQNNYDYTIPYLADRTVYPPYQILPNLHLPTQAADLPFYSDMLSIHPGGIPQIWTDKRILAGAQTHSSLSPEPQQ